jgi:hypothetical protein
MKRLNRNQGKWMSPSALKQDYRRHLCCVLYEPGLNAQRCQKLLEEEYRGAHRTPFQTLGLQLQLAAVANISLNCSGSKASNCFDPLVAQNRFIQNKSKPRFAFMRATSSTDNSPTLFSRFNPVVFP